MNAHEHYPHVRVRAESGGLLVREGVCICFYLRPSHDEVKESVARALDIYLRWMGPHALIWTLDDDGEWQDLDETGWTHARQELLGPRFAHVALLGRSRQYAFEYFGRHTHHPTFGEQPNSVRAVQFWLPTEYLEEHGPARVRELALELAGVLPFASGHAGLAFHAELDLVGVPEVLEKWCWRYPGLDVLELDWMSLKLGKKVRGPAWLTFLGPPVLDELGGVDGLRARLHAEGTTVREIGEGRAIITLGEWPEAGDVEQGETLAAYRELAKVLEPWLYLDEHTGLPPDRCRSLRWQRRFLD
ncbi:DUF3396 domain-containing protein [Myxococcaceae bacterium GXIMD 01537]